jgi:ATP-dependent exoDNAse (exonuclease V) beta subunit
MPERILKVEASAGSGKTYRLTLEFLTQLFRALAPFGKTEIPPAQLRQIISGILAITFTKKAANEMKSRILQRLKELALRREGFAVGEESVRFTGRLIRESRVPEKRMMDRSNQIVEALLAGYDDFHVKTIDSLMSAIIQVLSPDLGLPPDFEIEVDASIQLKSAVTAFIESESNERWPQVEAFLEDIRSFQGLRQWRLDATMADSIIQLFNLALRQHEPIIPEDGTAARIKLEEQYRRLTADLERLLAILDEEPREKGKNVHVSGTFVRAPFMENLRQLVERNGGNRVIDALTSSTFFAKEDPGELLHRACPPDYRQRFVSIYAQGQASLAGYLHLLSSYRTVHFRNFFTRFLEFWKKDRRVLFVEEFSKTLYSRLSDWKEEAYPYLYLKLSDRYRHFLFDEFQDTSELQFKALSPIIDEILSSEKHATLFLVGDRKQAIYRWRGGNADLMDEELLAREIPAVGHVSQSGFSTTLAENWRSGREIVDFNNRFWEPDHIRQTVEPGYLEDAVARNFAAARQQVPEERQAEKGYVSISIRIADRNREENDEEEPDVEEEELIRLLGTIETVRDAGYRYQDIAILTRENKQSRRIIQFLNSRNIHSLSDESLFLSTNPEVNEIIAFLRFLDFPPDDLNFYNFIRGEIFGREFERRFPEEAGGFTDDRLIDRSAGTPAYKVFRETCPRAWEDLIEPFFRAVGFLPPYDLVADFTQTFRLYENFQGSSQFILTLSEMLHQLEKDQVHSIAAFVDEWERMLEGLNEYAIETPRHSSAIRVSTIHKAKGLEFPVVILPLFGGRGGRSLPVFLDRGELYQVTKEYAALNPHLRSLYQAELTKNTIDELNLLYVAFTRAQKALFVSGVIPRSGTARKKNPFPSFPGFAAIIASHPLMQTDPSTEKLEFIEGEFDVREVAADKQETPFSFAITSKRIATRDWQRDYLVFAESTFQSRKEKEAIAHGEKIHRILARLDSAENVEELSSRLGLLAGEDGLEGQSLVRMVEFFRREDVFRFFRKDRGRDYAEKEVALNRKTGVEYKRIDRVLIGPDTVTILDFKTGSESKPDHTRQLSAYAEALKPLFAGMEFKAFLLYIDRNEVTEVSC